jgi:D-glycero-D-manno-heptose 1,7-bisphosphate phosphatase
MEKNQLFLVDCDGTIRKPIAGKKHINKPHEQRIIQPAETALNYFREIGCTIIGITNQAGVAAKHKSLEDCINEQHYTLELLPAIEGIYFCPDFKGQQCWYVTPTESLNLSQAESRFRGLYRKPNPGMLLLAMQQAQVSKKDCTMIGDRADDETAAARAGIDFITAEVWWNNYKEIAEKFTVN